MSYNETKVDKALDLLGMYSSFDEVKENLGLNKSEFNELQNRAKKRFGNDIFGN